MRMAVPLLVKPLPVSETSLFRPGLRVSLDKEVHHKPVERLLVHDNLLRVPRPIGIGWQ
jgi:hypothetical protein